MSRSQRCGSITRCCEASVEHGARSQTLSLPVQKTIKRVKDSEGVDPDSSRYKFIHSRMNTFKRTSNVNTARYNSGTGLLSWRL